MGRAQKEWKLLRRKVGAVADQDWANLQAHPGTFTVTVGGTASNGDYIITIVPDDSALAQVPNTFNRAGGETNAQIATGLNDEVETNLAAGGTAFDYIETVSVSGTTVTILPKESAPPFTVTVTAPGTGTLTLSPDDLFPIAKSMSFYRAGLLAMTAVEIAFVAVDASNVPLADDNSMTLTAEVVEVVPRANALVSGGNRTPRDLAVGVTSFGTTTSHPLNDKLSLKMNGSANFGVRLSAIATTPTGYNATEVWVRESVD